MSSEYNGPPQSENGGVWYQHPPKKKRTWLKALLVIVGLFVLGIVLLVSCTMGAVVGGASSTESQDTPDTATSQEIETPPEDVEIAEETSNEKAYTLVASSTSGSAQVMWGSMNATQTETFNGSWTTEVDIDPSDLESMTTLYVSNYEMGSTGEVTCQILDSDGVVVEENTASGEYASANCSTDIDFL